MACTVAVAAFVAAGCAPGGKTVDRSSASYKDGYQAGKIAAGLGISSDVRAHQICDQILEMVVRYAGQPVGDGSGITAYDGASALTEFHSTQSIYGGRTI